MLRSALAILALLVVALHSASAQTMRWVQTKTAVSPSARFGFDMVYDSHRQEIVLFGGEYSNTLPYYSGETWILKDGSWSLRKPLSSPHARSGHAMAYDSARREVILVGGRSRFTLNATLIWDGINWVRRTQATPSPVRIQGHAMAYDAVRKRTVLFGNGQTWEWGGTTWRLLNPTVNPGSRVGHAMAYDSVRKRIVLFGGSGTGGYKADTWTWDGKVWAKMSPTLSPPGRTYGHMVFDLDRQVVVLFGGLSSASSVTDTWTWNGKTWAKEAMTVATPARYEHAMAYDAKSKQTVLFGGMASSYYLGDTWRLVSYSAASATLYGIPCGTFPGVRLSTAVGSLPALGENLVFQIQGLPASTTAGLLSVGFSRTAFGPVKLPIDLSSLGMKGCHLYNSFDIQFVFGTSAGLGTLVLPVPYLTSLRGQRAFAQAFGSDRLANRLGLVSSNGLRLTFGYR